MSHSNVGELTEDFTLKLTSDILKPVGISKGSNLTGLIYPPEESSPPVPFRKSLFDIMLTTIPYDFWPISAQFTIKLLHKPGSFNEIANVFKKYNCNILIPAGCRCGHRYDTWDIAVGFEDIDKNKISNDFCDRFGYYKETMKRAKEIRRIIEKDCRHILFYINPQMMSHGVFQANYLHRSPVTFIVNTSLTYFWNITNSAHFKKKGNYTNIFKLQAVADNSIISVDDEFRRSIERYITYINDVSTCKYNIDDFYRSLVYASCDTKSMNIRAVIFPKKEIDHMFCAQLDWHTIDESSSVGLMSEVTRYFASKSWNIWRINSRDTYHIDKSESGRLNFILESEEEMTNVDDSKFTDQHKKVFTSSLPEQYKITKFKFCSFKSMYYKHKKATKDKISIDFAISCRKDLYDYGLELAEELSKLGYTAETLYDLTGGDHSFNKIKEKVKSARVLLVLVDDKLGKVETNTLDGFPGTPKKIGEWSLWETTVASALDIRIVPVAYNNDGYNFSNLPADFTFVSGMINGIKLDFKRKKKHSEGEIEKIYYEEIGMRE